MVEMTMVFRGDDINNDNGNADSYDEPDDDGMISTKSTGTTTQKVTTTKAILIRKATILTTMFTLVML